MWQEAAAGCLKGRENSSAWVPSAAVGVGEHGVLGLQGFGLHPGFITDFLRDGEPAALKTLRVFWDCVGAGGFGILGDFRDAATIFSSPLAVSEIETVLAASSTKSHLQRL